MTLVIVLWIWMGYMHSNEDAVDELATMVFMEKACNQSVIVSR